MKRVEQEPGDVRLNEERGLLIEGQPLTLAEQKLVKRAYQLFYFFRDRLRPVHDEMRLNRLMRQKEQAEAAPTAPALNTLNSCIDNVVADQIDNTPEAVMVPEREETAQSAEEITDAVAYVLYQANWSKKYHTIIEDSSVVGTGVAQVIWDEDMEDGDGMVNVLAWHPENIYPDPMYEDWQQGRAIFKRTNTTVAWVEEHYPDAAGYVKADDEHEELTGDQLQSPDGDQHTTLIEFWYKRYDAKKRKTHVHFAQLAGGALLYSTETGYGISERDGKRGYMNEGVYAHGQYPFIPFRFRTVAGRPFGTGLVHDYGDTQVAIDRNMKYIDDNSRESSVQRHFIRRGSGISADDIADMNKRIIEWEGNDIREVLQTVQAAPLNGQVFQSMQYLIEIMKQDCGQNAFSRGEGGFGITAASAIQALQEAGSKITRMHTADYKNDFRAMVEQVMWVLSEYLEPGRVFRIVGDWTGSGNMENRIIEMLAPKKEGDRLPKPAYTVRVQVQKSNPLQVQKDNEFLGQVAQIAAQGGSPLPPEAVVKLMEGYRTKPSVLRMLNENSQVQQMIQQLQAQNEQLQAQLSQQKEANAGYLRALSSQGGGEAAQEPEVQGEIPNYGQLVQEPEPTE